MKKMRKMGMLALVLVLSLTLLAGCGSKDDAKQDVPAPAPTGEEPLKIGLVFDVGGRGDLSFNDMAYAGLERAKLEYGDKIEVEYLEPAGSGDNREELMRLLAQQGYDLIFGVGFMFTEHIDKLSKEFPDVKFGLIDGFIPDLTADSNVVSLLFTEHEGSFLVGAAAALKSENNSIGFIGGMQIPLIQKFEAGYLAGAYYVNPDIKIQSDYIGTTGDAFRDPVKGRELALSQYQRGADIIYHAAGASGTGLFEAAVQTGNLAIGVDADQSLTVSEAQRAHVLTSMMKRVDIAVYNTIVDLVEGNFEGGYHMFGLAEEGVGYALNDFNREMMADIVDELEVIKGKIIDGEIVVPVDMEDLAEFKASLGN